MVNGTWRCPRAGCSFNTQQAHEEKRRAKELKHPTQAPPSPPLPRAEEQSKRLSKVPTWAMWSALGLVGIIIALVLATLLWPTNNPATAPTVTATPIGPRTPAPTSVVNGIQVQGISAALEGIKLPNGSTVTEVKVRVTLINESVTSQTYSLTIKNGEAGGAAVLNPRTLESGQQITIEQPVSYAMGQKIQVYLNGVFVGEVTPTAS